MRKLTGKLEVILAAIIFAGAALTTAPAALAGQDNDSSAVQSRLSKKQYQNVKATVNNGIATLTGTVDLYEYKADAQKTALKTKGVTAVRNEIQVAGNVSDADLQKKLVDKLSYDQVGYGHTFDAISVKVQNGTVTVGGHAHNYVNRDSALALVAISLYARQLGHEERLSRYGLAFILVPLMALLLSYFEIWPERALGAVFGDPSRLYEYDSDNPALSLHR